jgi:beta-glucanase (GH16 family)
MLAARRRLALVVGLIGTLLVAGILTAPGATRASTRSFHLRFDGEFSGTRLSSSWTQYNGHDGCCAMTYWARTHLVEGGGVLTMRIGKDPAYGYKWIAAGMSQGRSLNQTYGIWSVRFRMGRGAGTALAMMLWPQSGWPPEIDFAEEGPSMGGSRSEMTSTLHYGSGNIMIHHSVRADFTKWHRMSVRWTPGRIEYLLDGRTWATIAGSMVPHQPMHLCIQTEVGPKGTDRTLPTSTTPSPTRLQIDWVHVYRYS